MNGRIPSIGVVLIKNDDALLVRHGEKAQHFTGVYGLPSGRVEEGETAKEAAKRELKEETGLDTELEDLIELPTAYVATINGKTGPREFDWTVFHCTSWSGELLGSAETTPEWVPISQLASLSPLPNVENAIKEARNLS